MAHPTRTDNPLLHGLLHPGNPHIGYFKHAPRSPGALANRVLSGNVVSPADVVAARQQRRNIHVGTFHTGPGIWREQHSRFRLAVSASDGETLRRRSRGGSAASEADMLAPPSPDSHSVVLISHSLSVAGSLSVLGAVVEASRLAGGSSRATIDANQPISGVPLTPCVADDTVALRQAAAGGGRDSASSDDVDVGGDVAPRPLRGDVTKFGRGLAASPTPSPPVTTTTTAAAAAPRVPPPPWRTDSITPAASVWGLPPRRGWGGGSMEGSLARRPPLHRSPASSRHYGRSTPVGRSRSISGNGGDDLYWAPGMEPAQPSLPASPSARPATAISPSGGARARPVLPREPSQLTLWSAAMGVGMVAEGSSSSGGSAAAAASSRSASMVLPPVVSFGRSALTLSQPLRAPPDDAVARGSADDRGGGSRSTGALRGPAVQVLCVEPPTAPQPEALGLAGATECTADDVTARAASAVASLLATAIAAAPPPARPPPLHVGGGTINLAYSSRHVSAPPLLLPHEWPVDWGEAWWAAVAAAAAGTEASRGAAVGAGPGVGSLLAVGGTPNGVAAADMISASAAPQFVATGGGGGSGSGRSAATALGSISFAASPALIVYHDGGTGSGGSGTGGAAATAVVGAYPRPPLGRLPLPQPPSNRGGTIATVASPGSAPLSRLRASRSPDRSSTLNSIAGRGGGGGAEAVESAGGSAGSPSSPFPRTASSRPRGGGSPSSSPPIAVDDAESDAPPIIFNSPRMMETPPPPPSPAGGGGVARPHTHPWMQHQRTDTTPPLQQQLRAAAAARRVGSAYLSPPSASPPPPLGDGATFTAPAGAPLSTTTFAFIAVPPTQPPPSTHNASPATTTGWGRASEMPVDTQATSAEGAVSASATTPDGTAFGTDRGDAFAAGISVTGSALGDVAGPSAAHSGAALLDAGRVTPPPPHRGSAVAGTEALAQPTPNAVVYATRTVTAAAAPPLFLRRSPSAARPFPLLQWPAGTFDGPDWFDSRADGDAERGHGGPRPTTVVPLPLPPSAPAAAAPVYLLGASQRVKHTPITADYVLDDVVGDGGYALVRRAWRRGVAAAADAGAAAPFAEANALGPARPPMPSRTPIGAAPSQATTLAAAAAGPFVVKCIRKRYLATDEERHAVTREVDIHRLVSALAAAAAPAPPQQHEPAATGLASASRPAVHEAQLQLQQQQQQQQQQQPPWVDSPIPQQQLVRDTNLGVATSAAGVTSVTAANAGLRLTAALSSVVKTHVLAAAGSSPTTAATPVVVASAPSILARDGAAAVSGPALALLVPAVLVRAVVDASAATAASSTGHHAALLADGVAAPSSPSAPPAPPACSRIVRLYDVYEDAQHVYLVLEAVPGGDLASFVRAKSVRSFSEPQARRIMSQLLEALEFLHGAGVLHADVKPSNILVADVPLRDAAAAAAAAGTSTFGVALSSFVDSIKLCDFGAARRSRDPRYYRVTGDVGLVPYSVVTGTYGYVAPEILARRGYGTAVDLFSAGVIMYELLAGFSPFRPYAQCLTVAATFPEQVWGGISAEARSLCRALLERNPARRPTASAARSHDWFARGR